MQYSWRSMFVRPGNRRCKDRTAHCHQASSSFKTLECQRSLWRSAPTTLAPCASLGWPFVVICTCTTLSPWSRSPSESYTGHTGTIGTSRRVGAGIALRFKFHFLNGTDLFWLVLKPTPPRSGGDARAETSSVATSHVCRVPRRALPCAARREICTLKPKQAQSRKWRGRGGPPAWGAVREFEGAMST